MRYGNAERLIQLAIEMQAARTGLTITDVMERFSVSRRTAIRMRDAVLSAFPQAEEVQSPDRRKRWRLPLTSVQKLIGVTADQLAALELGASALERMDLAHYAEIVRGLGGKIKAMLAEDALRQIEPDYDALVQSEVIMHRARPASGVAVTVLEQLRSAIKSCRKVRFDYTPPGEKPDRRDRVAPLGLIYGHRHYLAGRAGSDPQIKFYVLGRISNVAIAAESFDVDQHLAIQELVSLSFGASSEEPQEIIWKFSAEASDVARDYVFHPKQCQEDQPDGGLIVRFTAGGLLEMAWHLIQWGHHVEVIAPQSLQRLIAAPRQTWPALP